MTEKIITKHYPKEDITIVWQPHRCIHSTRCFRGLPAVFHPQVNPWITPEGATRQEIIEQVGLCPSGALSIQYNKGLEAVAKEASTKITVSTKGPYFVQGTVELVNETGEVIDKKENFALCRCGHSSKKPFCDGSHRNFNDWLEENK